MTYREMIDEILSKEDFIFERAIEFAKVIGAGKYTQPVSIYYDTDEVQVTLSVNNEDPFNSTCSECPLSYPEAETDVFRLSVESLDFEENEWVEYIEALKTSRERSTFRREVNELNAMLTKFNSNVRFYYDPLTEVVSQTIKQ